MASSAALLAWPEPSAYHKVRQRGGEAVIIDPQPGSPTSAIVVLHRLRLGQVTAFDFWHDKDLERFRRHLYDARHNGLPRRYITRAHGSWVMVMRVE